MKNILFSFHLLYILTTNCLDVTAQESPFAGFYDASKMELVFHLYILPNHEFAASLIYGSEDRLMFGTWKETGDHKITLEEQRQSEDPFLVYAAEGSPGKRFLNFRYFDQNTEVAMAFGEPFKASELKYVLKPDEYSFSYSYHLEVPIPPSNLLHLSRQLSAVEHEVYDFKLSEKENEVILLYNSHTDKPLFKATASLVNGELMMAMEGETATESPFAKKQALPKDSEKQIEESKNNVTIPDQQEMKINDNIKLFRRIKVSKIHQAISTISPNQSYFGNEMNDDTGEAISPVPPPPVISK